MTVAVRPATPDEGGWMVDVAANEVCKPRAARPAGGDGYAVLRPC